MAPNVPRTTRNRLRELDLLRFLAAFVVLMFHFCGTNGGPWPDASRDTFPGLAPIAQYGYLGVDLFFVISGFVILMSAWGRGPGEFGVSRVVRLMPAYWVSVLLIAATYALFHLGDGSPARIVPNLTMLQSGLSAKSVDGVYWTLWVELHFYALIAVFAAIGITYQRCIAFMAGWLFLGVFATEADSKVLQTVLVPEWAPYFIAGMALHLIYRFGSSLLPWGFVAVCWLASMHWSVYRSDHVEAWKYGSPAVIALIVTGIYGLMILVATERLRFLSWKGLTIMGGLTYPLYLTHSAVARVIGDKLFPGPSRWAVLFLMIGCSLAVAYVVYRWVERPAQAWLRPRLRESLARARFADASMRTPKTPTTPTTEPTPAASSPVTQHAVNGSAGAASGSGTAPQRPL